MRIIVILTCYNRCAMTINCIRKLYEGNPGINFTFVVAEDHCSDRTVPELEKLQQLGVDIRLLHGEGDWFWCGGMRAGIACAKELLQADQAGMDGNVSNAEAILLVNDDVDFQEHAIEKMVASYDEKSIVVGPVCDAGGNLSYGGICYVGKGVHFEMKGPDYSGDCDTFNANCVLIPREVFRQLPNIDEKYVHSLGDFDLGLSARRFGIPIRVHSEFVGICNDNEVRGGWQDTALSRRERLKQKESPKGAPFRPWFHFLNKNFGPVQALIHGFTPYIRILLGK